MRKIVLLMTFMYINCATIAFAKPYQDKEHYNIHYNNQPYSKVKEEYLEEMSKKEKIRKQKDLDAVKERQEKFDKRIQDANPIKHIIFF